MLPSPRHERLGSPVVSLTRLQDSCLVALRPARLLPPKRLLTPRSARRLSATNRGLLPGAPAITRAGLAPAGLVQFSGRTMQPSLVMTARVSTFVLRLSGEGRAP
jgi:hypothetical protein